MLIVCVVTAQAEYLPEPELVNELLLALCLKAEELVRVELRELDGLGSIEAKTQVLT